MKNPIMEIVLLEKTDGGQFSKKIELSEDGQDLVKTQAPGGLSNMTAKRVKLDNQDPLNTLSSIIDRIQGNQALTMGRVPAGIPDGNALLMHLLGSHTKFPLIFRGISPPSKDVTKLYQELAELRQSGFKFEGDFDEARLRPRQHLRISIRPEFQSHHPD